MASVTARMSQKSTAPRTSNKGEQDGLERDHRRHRAARSQRSTNTPATGANTSIGNASLRPLKPDADLTGFGQRVDPDQHHGPLAPEGREEENFPITSHRKPEVRQSADMSVP